MKDLMKILGITLCAGTILAGDGSDEAGFINPPRNRKLPPAPPRSIGSQETFIPGGCTTPQAVSESKKPPMPPVMLIKLKD